MSAPMENVQLSPRKPGRPSLRNDKVSEEICHRLIYGESLRNICADSHMPGVRTVFDWLSANSEFRQQYARAREFQMDAMAEEILAIADDSTNDTVKDRNGKDVVNTEAIQRSRLRVDTRMWLMSKLAPKKYGDKVAVDHGLSEGADAFTELLREIRK